MQVSGYAFGALLATIVTAIAVIDFQQQIIPDTLNAILAAGGGVWQIWNTGGIPLTAIGFGLFVFGMFFAVRSAFGRIRGIDGLGLGDVKMAAAGSLWFSPWNFPLFLLVACTSAIAFVGAMAVRDRTLNHQRRLPFGPFLGFGLLCVFALERSQVTTFIPSAVY